ncbi:MAG: leucine dehydrogenase [Melioribacteraceae bacterium]|nr:leucine dehydrogenase [Melioribacteraceae bacterium]
MTDQNLLAMNPQELNEYLNEKDIKKFYLIYDDKSSQMTASHPELQPLADFISNDKRDFDNHEGIFVKLSSAYNSLLAVFVHRTDRGQSAGGTRFWHYSTTESFLRDGMRLAKGMTHKNALAGLWWGGGKGIITHDPSIDKTNPDIRTLLYREFGEFITTLRGCYVTAEDVGTNVRDMAEIFSRTRFTTCIPFKFGGSGNPSVPTARGVVSGIEAALNFLNMGEIESKIIAVQGLGNVGRPLIKFLFEKGAKKIIAHDIDTYNYEIAEKEFENENVELKLVDKSDTSIFGMECDIFSPCAVGAILNPETISLLKSRIVCGAANNQLEDPVRDDKLLAEKNVLFVPDFLTNRMGIVNCANEQYGYVNDVPYIEKHLQKDWEYSIYQMAMKVFNQSKETGESPAKAAVKIADELSFIEHPIFGHRGRQIINSLVEDEWHKN